MNGPDELRGIDRSPRLRPLLPDAAAVAEMRGAGPADRLFPEEAHAVRAAVAARRHEFAVGRTCARRALRQLGHEPKAIPPAADRSPRWPSGVVGSITHCVGYGAAAVAPTSAVVSLGIDAEPSEPLPACLVGLVAHGRELDWIAAHPGRPWDRTILCAKESIYKAWHPQTKRWLDFDDVLVEFDEATGRFAGEILAPAQPTTTAFPPWPSSAAAIGRSTA